MKSWSGEAVFLGMKTVSVVLGISSPSQGDACLHPLCGEHVTCHRDVILVSHSPLKTLPSPTS